MKNFFERHTSPPPRRAFAPPAPLCNEPGCFDRFTNLLCVNLLQYRNTCFCVATSVKNSVFGVHFWRGGFVYILRKWIFIFTAFMLFFRLVLSCLVLPLFLSFFWFVLFCSYLVLSQFVTHLFLPLFRLFWFVCFDSFLPLIRAICPIVFRAYCQPGRGGVTFGSLVNVPRYHVATLPRYRVATLIVVAAWSAAAWSVEDVPHYLRLQIWKLTTLWSCEAVLRLKILQLLGYPSATPAACR